MTFREYVALVAFPIAIAGVLLLWSALVRSVVEQWNGLTWGERVGVVCLSVAIPVLLGLGVLR